MGTKTTQEILYYYNNYCLKGTTPLKELDNFVNKRWVSFNRVYRGESRIHYIFLISYTIISIILLYKQNMKFVVSVMVVGFAFIIILRNEIVISNNLKL